MINSVSFENLPTQEFSDIFFLKYFCARFFILLFLLIPGTLTAGTDFCAQDVISEDSAYSVGTGDFDKDGDVDIVAALDLKTAIVWYENDGSGQFTEEHTVCTDAENIQSVHVADMNGDDAPDIIAALHGSSSGINGKLLLYINSGTGSFGSAVVIDEDSECYGLTGIYADDLDEDGDLDIISAACNSNKVTWYKNDGGNFSQAQQMSFPNASCVTTADIDGDGKKDIVSGSDSHDEIVWFIQGADGSFTKAANPVSTTASGVCALAVTNLTDDSKPDIIAACGGTGNTEPVGYEDEEGDFHSLEGSCAGHNIEWYENLIEDPSSDVFPEKNIIAPDADSTTDVLLTQINSHNDDIADLVFTSMSDGAIYFCFGKGPGSDPGLYEAPYNPFDDPVMATDDVDYVKSVASADFDGDGDNDIVSASFYYSESIPGKIQWFKNVNGYIISDISGETTEAGEGTATFTIRPDTKPISGTTITISVSSSDETEGTVSTDEIIFDETDWSTDRTITVTGVNDGDDDGDQTYYVVLGPVTSDDPNYKTTDPDDVRVVNVDDDDEFNSTSSSSYSTGSSGSCFVGTLED